MDMEAPIIVLDDDRDDLELVSEAHKELNIKYPLILMDDSNKLLKYLHESSHAPFMILSDYNLPKINGIELRKKILEESATKYKSIPYLIWSTGATEKQVKRVFDTYIQ